MIALAFLNGFAGGFLSETLGLKKNRKPSRRGRSPLARAVARPELVPAVGREPAPAPGQVEPPIAKLRNSLIRESANPAPSPLPSPREEKVKESATPGDIPVMRHDPCVFPVRPPSRFRKVITPDARSRLDASAVGERMDAGKRLALQDAVRAQLLDQEIRAGLGNEERFGWKDGAA